MNDQGIVVQNILLLVAMLLIAFATACGVPSASDSRAKTRNPCDSHQTSETPESQVKDVQSVECSSSEECLKLGQRYLGTPSRMDAAKEALEKALALDPENTEASKQLALAYMRSYEGVATGHLSAEEYCRAETLCKAVISLHPNDAEAYFLLGQILNGQLYWGLRDDDASVQALKKTIELRPDWADAYCELGHAYDLLNRYEDAVAAYTAEENLTGQNETGQGQISPATLEYQRAHEVRDAFIVAQIYTKMAKYNEALTSLQSAANIDPGNELIHFWTCKTFLSLGDIQSAKREQELLAELCKSKNKFFITQCEVSAKQLLDEIEQKSR